MENKWLIQKEDIHIQEKTREEPIMHSACRLSHYVLIVEIQRFPTGPALTAGIIKNGR